MKLAPLLAGLALASFATVAVADALLCSRIQGTTHIDSDNEGLRWGEPATAVKKLPQ